MAIVGVAGILDIKRQDVASTMQDWFRVCSNKADTGAATL